MADLVDYVTASDSVKISKLSFKYRVDPDVLPDGTVLQYDLCPAKPEGKLLLDLDLSKLGFPGLDFHATAIGNREGTGDVIRWDIAQQIGKDVPPGVTLDHIAGHFSTLVEAVDPAVKLPSCEGTERYYGAVLNTTGSDNGLVLKVHKDVAGVSHHGTVTIEDFRLDATVGEPLALKVSVAIPSSECTRPIVEGGQAEAFALTSGVPLGVKESYAWRIEGGVPVGPTDQWKVRFTTPTTEPVFVSVDVQAGDQTAFDTAIVRPIPAALMPILSLICRLRTIAQINLFVNPLWDPLRDYTARPVAGVELRRVGELGKELSRLGAQISQTVERISGRR